MAPSRPVTAYKTHDALAGRIDALLKARGLSFVEWMQAETGKAIEAGEIPFNVPGFEVTVLDRDHPEAVRGPAVRLAFSDARVPDLLPPFARQVATIIHTLTLTRGRDAIQTVRVAPGIDLSMIRKGKGLILAVSVEGHDKATAATLPLSMGLDLAEVIRRAANDAQGITAEEAAELEALGA